MIFFPLINFVFLIILYIIHRSIFWVVGTIELALYIGGTYWVYQNFSGLPNRMYYMFTLTGIGFIVVLVAFVIAIFHNHHTAKS